ncbi:MAG: hypothetical protein JW776_10640 [Candidatus Lokiarchaeota archaeon]|nr:hypothetical protein [Candidatus Lokiarchaeota archaeon]
MYKEEIIPIAIENSNKSNSPSMEILEEEICFVIMPFAGWFNDYYSSIYCPAIEAASMTPFRADNLYRPSTIVNDIWLYTQKAKIILADLSGKNPNVFYELGLAHGLAKPAILITNSMEDVPFDLRALRVLLYDKNEPRWGDILQDQITRVINEVKESPLEAVLPTFLSVDSESNQNTISPNDKILLELRNDIDLLRSELGRKRSIRYNSSQITESEAEIFIDDMKSNNVPENIIAERLFNLGVPSNWIINRLGSS